MIPSLDEVGVKEEVNGKNPQNIVLGCILKLLKKLKLSAKYWVLSYPIFISPVKTCKSSRFNGVMPLCTKPETVR